MTKALMTVIERANRNRATAKPLTVDEFIELDKRSEQALDVVADKLLAGIEKERKP